MSRVGNVTGRTRGVGEAISIMLKDNGYTVSATYTGNDKAAAAFSKANGINVYRFNVGDFDACETSIAQITADLGPIEVLVNNAGITRDGNMNRMERDKWDAVINTNLGSCFNMSRLVIESMRSEGFGRIVNIGSINDQAGQYGQVNYATQNLVSMNSLKRWLKKRWQKALQSMQLRQATLPLKWFVLFLQRF